MAFRLSRNQTLELSKYWFDLSKLTFASLILKLFEPGVAEFTSLSVATVLLGLIGTVLFVMIGLVFSKKVK